MLNKIITYLLLFAYSTTVTMPVLPYFSDLLAHTFWLYEHISTVHYEHGQYHTHFQSIEISKKTDAKKSTTTTKSSSNNSEHIVAAITYPIITFSLVIENTANSAHSFYLPKTDKLTDFPPPKA